MINTEESQQKLPLAYTTTKYDHVKNMKRINRRKNKKDKRAAKQVELGQYIETATSVLKHV